MKKRRTNRLITQIFQLITVFVFVSFIIVFGLIFLFSPKSDYSVIEKRPLTEFPKFSIKSLSEGSFTDDITKYVSDNFVLREKFVSLSRTLEENRGIKYDGLTTYSSGNESNIDIDCIDTPPVKVSKSVPGYETQKLGEKYISKVDFNQVVENTDIYSELDEEEIKGQQVGALYVIKDMALEIFYGNSNIIKDFVNILNTYRLAVPQTVNVYSAVVPTHFEFALPAKYKNEIGKEQKPFIDELYSQLNPDIKTVDVYTNIKNHFIQKEYLYFRTDHHWTALGAYRAYEAFADSAGFEPTPLSMFEERRVERFLGTFYSSTFNNELENNPDVVNYFAPTNQYSVTNYNQDGTIATTNGYVVANKVSGDSNGYLVFMGGDKPLSVIETDAGTGRSLIVFKESYGNAFVPFLTRNFDKIYVADIRTFPFNAVNFVVDNGISDVLFLNNIMTSCSPPRIKNYLDLMSK